MLMTVGNGHNDLADCPAAAIARADGLRAIGIGWVLVEKDAPGSAEPVAGGVVHDGRLLRVVRLEGDVREQPLPRVRVLAQALAWAASVALLLGGLIASLRKLATRSRHETC